MGNIRFERNKSAVEIDPFDQKSNGGAGITYTLYYYPDKSSDEFDPDATEAFYTLSAAIEKALHLLKWEKGKGDR